MKLNFIKMAEIKLFLLSSIENELNINQFFPSENNNQQTKSELLKINEYFKRCGDGCLQTKDFKYYYKTYISLLKNGSNFFLLFYCTKSYKEKNIDKLCEEIFLILDDDPFEEMEFKNSTISAINQVFLKYQHLEADINTKLFVPELKNSKIISRNESFDEKSDISSLKGYSNKRGDPRFYSYIINKQSSASDSDIFSDSNVFKNCSFDDDSRLTVGKKFKDNITNENFEKWKKVKKNYLIFSIILSILTYFLFPLLLKFFFN